MNGSHSPVIEAPEQPLEQNGTLLYVCLLSEFTVASAQAVHLLRPGKVLAISSLFVKQRGAEKRFAKCLEQWNIPLSCIGSDEQHPFPAESMDDSFCWLTTHLVPLLDAERKRGKLVIANLTGSTKAAAISLKNCWPHWHELHYTAEGTRNRLEVPGKGLFALAPLPPLEEAGLLNDTIRQQAWRWKKEEISGFPELAALVYTDYLRGREGSVLEANHELIEAMWGQVSAKHRQELLARFGVEQDGASYLLPSGPLQDLLYALRGVDVSVTMREGRLAVPCKPTHRYVRFLTGIWLEVLVAHWLKEAGIERAANIEIARDENGSTDSEADILARAPGGGLRLIECKAEPPAASGFTDLVKKLNNQTRHFGKTRCAFIVGPAFWWHCSEGVREQFEGACRLRDISIIDTQVSLLKWLGMKKTDLLPEYPTWIEIPTPVFQPSPEQLLEEAESLLASNKPQEQQRFEDINQIFIEHFPDQRHKIEQLQIKDEQMRALLKKAYGYGKFEGKREFLQGILPQAHNNFGEAFVERLEKNYLSGLYMRPRYLTEQKKRANGQPLSTVKPRTTSTKKTRLPQRLFQGRQAPPPPDGLHANDLRALEPRPSWTLLLDETGTEFAGNPEQDFQTGKFVGLLLDDRLSGLAPLPTGWHAVDCMNSDEIDQVVQAVLDSPSAVLGLHLRSIPITPGERWLDGMLSLIDWVLRLLPLDGQTRIEVLIEGRSPFPPRTDALVAARRAQAELARTWPERAALIDLTISTIGKQDHSHNGYVDALAFTWGSPSAGSKERLRRSGLLGTCLLTNDSDELLRFWDTWNNPGGLRAHDWATLVCSTDARTPASLVQSLLEAVKEQCRLDPVRWIAYLEETRRHLTSKRLDLRAIAAKVAWLEGCRPVDREVPPTLLLAWRTTQLALANHLGETELPWKDDFNRLRKLLFEEDAPLTCQADLHLAVCATNRFDFDLAGKALERWDKYDPMVPGLRFWGQIRSSLGQHAAFLGDNAMARGLFDEAIEAFRRLSDPLERTLELSQTLCYRVIALTDFPSTTREELLLALGEYFETLDLPAAPAAAIPLLAASTEPALKYAHHTLLRYLLFRDDRELISSYLSEEGRWDTGEGHPWPLILAYRGLLHSEQLRKIDLLMEASALAFSADQGPTVRLIGAVCRTLAWTLGGEPWANALVEYETLARALPCALERLNALAGWIEQPEDDPRALLVATLPFNFR